MMFLLFLACKDAVPDTAGYADVDTVENSDEPDCPGSVSTDASAAGERVVSAGGSVTARFNGGAADYSSVLALSAPSRVSIGTLHTTRPGTEVSLGEFDADVELVFELAVPDGAVWWSGPGERNADGLAHARIVEASEGVWYGGFEDLANTGDSDFNDVCFTIIGDVRVLPQ